MGSSNVLEKCEVFFILHFTIDSGPDSIEKKAKVKTLLEDSTLAPEKQADLSARMKELDLILEYNKVGKQYYDVYIKVINNPLDENLAKELDVLSSRLKELETLKRTNNISPKYEKIYAFPPLNMFPYLPHDKVA